MNKQRKVKEKYTPGSKVLTVFFIALCLVWVIPVIEVLINSFKSNNYVNLEPFALPTEESFVGLANYIKGVNFGNYPFIKALGFSLFITIVSVALILLFCSMTAWYIVRTKSTIANIFYYLCLFSMIVPFQMVMFTLTFTADTLKLNTPWTIPIVYLGFGAGLAIFMFTGFIKSLTLKIEICRGQSQQLALTDARPVKHLKCVVGNRLVHHFFRKFLVFLFRPEQHLPPFLCPHVSGFRCRIGVEIVKPDSVVENGAELIV